ncbi:hypothetical protein [Bradyrhizobium arachidis]|uniref:hypothetical protein n=1 Tax=Bradyrhizobium arachidis TaxID=858423 RepID=UPI0038D13CA9
MRPYPGYNGRFFKMPPRNIVPKPVQKPHPPLWMACSRRESILRAARHGMGGAGLWVRRCLPSESLARRVL